MHGRSQERTDASGQAHLQEVSGGLAIERFQRQLEQLAATFEASPQLADRMSARHALGAVGGDHDGGHSRQQLGQEAERVEGGGVRPVEIIDQDGERPVTGNFGQDGGNGLMDDGLVGFDRPFARAQLRQDRGQGASKDRILGVGLASPHRRAEDGRNRRVGRRGRFGGAGLEQPQPALRDRGPGQRRLADAGLAADQDQPAGALPRRGRPRAQLRQLRSATDQRGCHSRRRLG